MNARAWYLGCGREDVGECAVLVGDRGRVETAATLLSDPRWLNQDRGLTTVTGTREGRRITVSAFGMGAPIAAIVLHELASVGVRTFLRLGTALTLPPVQLGDLVLAHGAIRGESTSRTYLPLEFPALADPALTNALIRAAEDAGRRWVGGLIASYDGFYTQMFVPGGDRAEAAPETAAPAGSAGNEGNGGNGGAGRAVAAGRKGPAAGVMAPVGAAVRPVLSLAPAPAPPFEELSRLGVVGIDMETSAILTVARALGVRAGSLCLGTVDGIHHDRLSADVRKEAELTLLDIGMRGLLEASAQA